MAREYPLGRMVSSPCKPLYKPSLTDFEKAIADIEDRVEHIEYAAARFILEEQRQSNWFKVEKRNEKKTTLIRHLLHSDEDFDEDDFSDAVPLMVKFVSTHALDQLLDLCVDLCEKYRKQILMSKFVRSISSEEIFYSTDSEGSDKEYDRMSWFWRKFLKQLDRPQWTTPLRVNWLPELRVPQEIAIFRLHQRGEAAKRDW